MTQAAPDLLHDTTTGEVVVEVLPPNLKAELINLCVRGYHRDLFEITKPGAGTSFSLNPDIKE